MRTVADRGALDATALQREAAEQARIDAYLLLAAMLRGAPAAQLLESLAAMSVDATEDAPPLALAWRYLRDAASTADLQGIDDEFHALLIGVGRGELLPYASWYLAGFLMDKPLVTLRRDLERLGIERSPGTREPEDHAAALCETMALLGESGSPTSAGDQQRFFESHLGSWMPRFFADMQTAESADFYRAVGRLGSAFMEMERTWLRLPA
jgi:TorA maturation chaperone TorD